MVVRIYDVGQLGIIVQGLRGRIRARNFQLSFISGGGGGIRGDDYIFEEKDRKTASLQDKHSANSNPLTGR